MFDWNHAKDQWLKQERGVSFEDVICRLTHDEIIDTIEHPNQQKYPGQRIFIINIEGYVYIVPFVENDRFIFLKTIIPSRKMTKRYLGGNTI